MGYNMKSSSSPNRKTSSPRKRKLTQGSPSKKARSVYCAHVNNEVFREYWQATRESSNDCCVECGSSVGPLFKCLSCAAICCWRPSEAILHFGEHSRVTDHQLAVEMGSGCLYCAICNRFQWDDQLSKVFQAARAQQPFPEILFTPLPSHIRSHCNGIIIAMIFIGLRGFWNLGSTCFMNSVMQAILHCQPLIDYFMGGQTEGRPPHTRLNCSLKEGCMCCLLDDLIMACYSGETTPISPTALLQAIWHGSAHGLIGYEQQDAHEMLIELRNLLHTHAGGSSFNCQCIVHKLFAGVLQSVVTCGHCQASTECLDPFLDLSLEVADTLTQSFLRFIQPEKLPPHSYTCPSCHRNHQDACKQLLIRTAPPILTVHLKRFEHPAAAKLDQPVAFPFSLPLGPFSTEPQQSAAYRLFAVVGHVGSLDSGHYTVHVKHEDQWYWVDDAQVYRVAESHVRAANAYLLFYEK